VREVNFYKEGDVSPFKQTLTNVTVDRCWSQLLQQSNFENRRAAVDEFNRYQHFLAAYLSRSSLSKLIAENYLEYAENN